MAYSDFDLKKVRHEFGLQIAEQPDLFEDVPLVQPSAMLADTLAETAHLAMAIHTEKEVIRKAVRSTLTTQWIYEFTPLYSNGRVKKLVVLRRPGVYIEATIYLIDARPPSYQFPDQWSVVKPDIEQLLSEHGCELFKLDEP